MIRVSIIGGSGYSGLELIRLLLRHPEVEIKNILSRSYAGKSLSSLSGYFADAELEFSEINLDLVSDSDIVFFALPAEASIKYMSEIISMGKRVIDLSGAFRIKNSNTFKKWYDIENSSKECLKKSIYGLSEVNREKIRDASIVANPGCYPTSVLLPLIPLLKEGLFTNENIICDLKSGVSGKGRALKDDSLFCECNENSYAYRIGHHQHTPEVEQELNTNGGKDIKVTLVPHLVPLNRGILTTIYIPCKGSGKALDIDKIFKRYYENETFVLYRGNNSQPQIRDVLFTNRCDFSFVLCERTGQLVITSVIDNLLKGAAGQALQNMNIMFGLKEEISLV